MSVAAINNGRPTCQRIHKEVLVFNSHRNHTFEGCSSDSARCVTGFNEFYETDYSDQSLASMDDHMFNAERFGDCNWRGFTLKNFCQNSTRVLVAPSQPNSFVREENL